jgi:hypothetical protein
MSITDFQALQDRIEAFQRSRFPEQKLAGKFAHLAREVAELRANPDDPMEWADVTILLFGAAAMHEISAAALLQNAEAKLKICEARKWVPADEHGVHHHIE